MNKTRQVYDLDQDECIEISESSMDGCFRKVNTEIDLIENDERQYGAFEDVPYYQGELKDYSSLKMLEKDIRSAIVVIQVELPRVPVKDLIESLYNRLISNTLPCPKSSKSQLSEYKQPSRPTKYQVELISIEYKKDKSDDEDAGKQNQEEIHYKEYEPYKMVNKKNSIPIERSTKPEKHLSTNLIQRELQFIEETLSRNEEEAVRLSTFKIPEYYTIEERARFMQKRFAAKAFIRKGYGLVNMRKELQETPYSFDFELGRYKRISSAVATDTYRRLQQFIEQYCKRYKPKLVKFDIKYIYSILLNCRDLFPQETPTFIKFMQIQFNVDCDSLMIGKKEAIRLHEKIIELKNKRQGNDWTFEPRANKRRNFDEQQYARQLQSEKCCDADLLRFYREEKNISRVRDRFREKYGLYTEFQELKFIKNQLGKLLRLAIRKTKSASVQNRQMKDFLPFLTAFNNERIKKIVLSAEALEARVALCDIFLNPNPSTHDLRNTVIMMQEMIQRIQARRDMSDYQ